MPLRRDRRLAAVQTTYGALLPGQDASLQSRSCSDMSTGTGLGALTDASLMQLGGASSLEAGLTADERSAESSPTLAGDELHLVFGSLDESDGTLVRARLHAGGRRRLCPSACRNRHSVLRFVLCDWCCAIHGCMPPHAGVR